jgi:hypothetical protein
LIVELTNIIIFQFNDDTAAAVKLELQLRSELEFISCNEPQNSGAT